MIRYVSFDLACTLAWEPGCVEGIESTIEHGAKSIYRELNKLGYSTNLDRLVKSLVEIYNVTQRDPSGRDYSHLYRIFYTLNSVGVNPRPDKLQEILNTYVDSIVSRFRENNGAREVLVEVKRRGLKVIVSSDAGWHEIPLKVLKKTLLIDYVDVLFTSNMLGWSKRTARFYREVVKLLGVNPHDILHVGDSYERDYLSAKKAGLRAVLYNPHSCNKLDLPRSECINNLSDLLLIV